MYKLCGTGDLELQNTTINGECHGFTEFPNGSIKILWMFQITQCFVQYLSAANLYANRRCKPLWVQKNNIAKWLIGY
jgi:hypothetical protein